MTLGDLRKETASLKDGWPLRLMGAGGRYQEITLVTVGEGAVILLPRPLKESHDPQ